MAEIVMPRLSDTMEEGTILRWLKSDGETVSRGEELVEIETDKATMVYESDQEGPLTLIAAEGDTLPVGTPIARVGAATEDGDRKTGLAEASPAAPGPATPVTAAAPAPPEPRGDGATRVKASPLARRIASERGVDVAAIAGSGPGGRVVKADVEGAQAGGAVPVPAPAAAVDAVTTAKGTTTDVELTKLQQTVARRMAESKATIPDFSIEIDVDMQECVRLREQLKQLARDGAEAPPTYNDMVVKACALALREHPTANGSYRDGRVQLHSRVNVGVAVAAEGALVVPTLFDADTKALGEIAREARALAERVRAGTITPPELGGGTFTVSNLGMFGISSFAAIINPPQAAIMSVGALQRRAVVDEDSGEVIARPMLTLTLVCDHRILYGAEAALFLGRVRELLQAPAALTL
ncbi:MAG TPA: dihydrolipoamide acetyltransferase family protein [Solirubrobacteraceae bacterium]|jgi:pyruvate dehydrogenase E2 component (dihydrolipoamide acetyltransferase)|nr:dihydrolipoamide acetyltransferase family protein [Solirubrobacteraceae bacterium]